MKTIHALDPVRSRQLDTAGLREHFLLTDLFQAGKVELRHWEVDRAVIGGAVPTTELLAMPIPREMAAETFCERREVGVMNLGGTGTVKVDGTAYALEACDALYVGRGVKSITFASDSAVAPARFYLLSFPAHSAHPTRLVRKADANVLNLGSPAEANARVLRQYICPGRVESCQLVMGYTEMLEGSVWNTFKPHTHARRCEIYLYFGVSEGECVMHFMGEPTETRHLVVRDLQAALSPNWSIHGGCGSRAYAFVWGMGGENQVFTDMDPVAMDRLA
jgi:4-deoxy-L-threo-5-hexosulose-uronate ketol-isomerase